MKSREAREMLAMSRAEFFQLVQAGKIRVVSYGQGARGHEYSDQDVQRLYAQRRRQGKIKGPRTILTPAVREAVESLKEALDEALTVSGLTSEEAAGKLSLFVSDLWEECEALTERLPGKFQAA